MNWKFWNWRKVAQVTETLEQGQPVRICKQCDHYWSDGDNRRCRAFQAKVRHLVTGRKEWAGVIVACADNRARVDAGWCGREGRLWKPQRSLRERNQPVYIVVCWVLPILLLLPTFYWLHGRMFSN